MKIPEERRNRNDGTDENTYERDALHAETEVVDTHENDGEGFKPDVEEAVHESDVEVEEENHGLGEVKGERPD